MDHMAILLRSIRCPLPLNTFGKERGDRRCTSVILFRKLLQFKLRALAASSFFDKQYARKKRETMNWYL